MCHICTEGFIDLNFDCAVINKKKKKEKKFSRNSQIWHTHKAACRTVKTQYVTIWPFLFCFVLFFAPNDTMIVMFNQIVKKIVQKIFSNGEFLGKNIRSEKKKTTKCINCSISSIAR